MRKQILSFLVLVPLLQVVSGCRHVDAQTTVDSDPNECWISEGKVIDGRIKCHQFPTKNEKEFALFCAQTQSDDCLFISRDGRFKVGTNKAEISFFENGVVARLQSGRLMCGVSDTRISMSYLSCGKTGWQISVPGFINISNPWSPTDVFARE